MAKSIIPASLNVGPPVTRLSERLLRLQREIDQLFNAAFHDVGWADEGADMDITPRMNISETDQEIHVDMELPGVSDHDVQIELTGEVLTIRGLKQSAQGDIHQHLTERSFGAFVRTIRLPFAPGPDEVLATFERGVLHVAIGKSARQGRTHRVPVRPVMSETSQTLDNRGCVGTEAAVAGHPTENTTRISTSKPETADDSH